ncbi:FG-nucleoporin nsp1 [Tulasnella sp. 403]|nr:FG-nucleoporin nsp1 [Tulasnella sp. 403]
MSNPPTFGGAFTGFGNTNANSNTATNTNPSQPTPAPAQTQPSLFGGANLFGAPTHSPFGAAATNPATTAGQQPKPTFGSAFGSVPAASTTTGTGSLFGGAGSSLTTGNTPVGNTTSGNAPSTLFGKPGGLFGSTATATSGTTPATGSFFGSSATGNNAATTNAPAAPAPASAPAAGQNTTPSLFGNVAKPSETATGTSTAPAPMNSIFGNLGKPASTTPSLFQTPASTGAAPTSASTTLAAPSLFGNKDATSQGAGTTTGASAAPATTPLVFGAVAGAKDASKDGKDAAGTTAPAPGTGFSLNLAKAPSNTTPSATTAPGFTLFGANAAKDAKDTAKPSLVAAASTTPAPSGPQAATAATTQDTSKTPAPATGTTTQPSATTTSTTVTSTAPLLPPSLLKGKSLEEIVDQWNSDLDVQSGEFKRLAGEVQEWDRILMENSSQIANLYAAVLQAEKTQQDVEKTLDVIEGEQKNIAEALDGYESVADNILRDQGMRGMDVGPADTERERNYNLATTLNAQLDELAGSLSSMIEEVNNVTATNSSYAMKPSDSSATLSNSQNLGSEDADPLVQIQSILNAHLEVLTWMNGSARELEGKVGNLERKFGNLLPAEERPVSQHPAPLGRLPTRPSLQQQSTVLDGGSVLGGSRYGSAMFGLRR